MKWIRLSVCLLFLPIVLSGCSPQNPPPETTPTSPPEISPVSAVSTISPPRLEDPVLAEWDGGKITRSQFYMILDSRAAQLKLSIQDPDSLRHALVSEGKATLGTLADNYLLVQEAHERGLGLTTAEQDQLMKQLRGNFTSEQAYREALNRAGQNEEDLVRVYSSMELAKKCMIDEREKIMASVTPEMVHEYYDDHRDLFTRKSRTDMNRVVTYFGEKHTEEEAREISSQLHQEVAGKVLEASGMEGKRKIFQDYALNHSESWEATYNYGFFCFYQDMPEAKQNYSQEFIDTTLQVPEGEMSGLIKDASSYVFFLVVNQFPPELSPFESEMVQRMIPNMILKDKMDEWRLGMHEKYRLKLYEDLLEDYMPSPEAPTAPSATDTIEESTDEAKTEVLTEPTIEAIGESTTEFAAESILDVTK